MRHDFTLDVTQQGSEIRVAGAFHKGWVPIIDFMPYYSWRPDHLPRLEVPGIWTLAARRGVSRHGAREIQC